MRHQVLGLARSRRPRGPWAGPVVLALVVGLIGGCGGSDVGPEDESLLRPRVDGFTPQDWSAGQPVHILGRGFCSAADCRSYLVFDGQYASSAAPTERVSLEVHEVEVEAATIRWRFGPNIPFSSRNLLGSFAGELRVVNIAGDGTKRMSEPYTVRLSVGPSIIVHQLRPLAGGCADRVISGTTEGTALLLEVEALGLAAQPEESIAYGYTFQRAHFSAGGSTRAEPVQTGAMTTLVQEVAQGSTAVLGGSASNAFAEVIAAPLSTSLSDTDLSVADWLRTAAATLQQGNAKRGGLVAASLGASPGAQREGTITVVAADATGKLARRDIPLRISRAVDLEVVERSKPVFAEEPVAVSGCEYGRPPQYQLRFTEQTVDEKTRTWELKLDGTLGTKAPLSIATLEATFGMQLGVKISSSQAFGQERTIEILPGEYAVAWRQAVEYRHEALVREIDACGETRTLGRASVSDWDWSYDIVHQRQESCPPLPQPTSFPPRGPIP
jgi:hypothetical protein